MKGLIAPMESADLKGSVLLVCGGNVCRSAAAFVLFRRALGSLPVEVASAGLQGREAMTVDPRTLVALNGRAPAGTASGFRSRRLSLDMLEAADLVLTATRSQRAEVVRMSPSSVRMTFTVLEFTELATDVSLMLGRTGDPRPQTIADFVALVPQVRGNRPVTRSIDLGDPMGRSQRTHNKVVLQIETAVSSIVGALVS